MSDRLPPFDNEAEEAVLAAGLVDPTALIECIEIVRPEMFYREKHGWIWAVMCDLWSREGGVNQIAVAHELGRRDQLEACGGQTFLADIIRRLPTSLGSAFYGNIVREGWRRRELIQVGARIQALGFDDSQADIDQLNERASEMVMRLMADRARPMTQTVGEIIAGGLGEQLLAVAGGEEEERSLAGVETGWDEFDEMVGRCRPGKLISLLAYPGIGKSFLTQWACWSFGRQGVPSLIVTTEMSASEITGRLVDIAKGRPQGSRSPMAEQARVNRGLGELADLPISITDVGRIHVRALQSEVRRQVAMRGIAVVVLDTLQEMRADGRDQRERLEELTSEAKGMALNNQVAVILVSHVKRDMELAGSVPPRLSLNSGHGSSSIEKNSDVVVALEPVAYGLRDRQPIDGWGLINHKGEYTRFQNQRGYVPIQITSHKRRDGLRSSAVRALNWNWGGQFTPLTEEEGMLP